ncbi:hypothetical protein NSQ43_10975 [Sporosarcina sp. FSL W8-0480]|uniref:hypothetical protein n=1 Tax=Sporosarcina sp. FSL W8-0480 TaxID=2954701 RepID=UPI0030DD2EF6
MSEQKFELILNELQKISTHVSHLDERVTQMDNRFSEIDERFSEMGERFTEMGERFTKMDERFSKMDNRFSKIETEQHRHGEHIQQLIQIVGATNNRLEAFQQDTTARFDRVDRSLRLVESDLDLILQKSNKHEREINRLKQITYE